MEAETHEGHSSPPRQHSRPQASTPKGVRFEGIRRQSFKSRLQSKRDKSPLQRRKSLPLDHSTEHSHDLFANSPRASWSFGQDTVTFIPRAPVHVTGPSGSGFAIRSKQDAQSGRIQPKLDKQHKSPKKALNFTGIETDEHGIEFVTENETEEERAAHKEAMHRLKRDSLPMPGNGPASLLSPPPPPQFDPSPLSAFLPIPPPAPSSLFSPPPPPQGNPNPLSSLPPLPPPAPTSWLSPPPPQGDPKPLSNLPPLPPLPEGFIPPHLFKQHDPSAGYLSLPVPLTPPPPPPSLSASLFAPPQAAHTSSWTSVPLLPPYQHNQP
eukprot:g34291.t1